MFRFTVGSMQTKFATLVGIVGLLATSPAWAVFKCTTPNGVVYQTAPCVTGDQRILDTLVPSDQKETGRALAWQEVQKRAAQEEQRLKEQSAAMEKLRSMPETPEKQVKTDEFECKYFVDLPKRLGISQCVANLKQRREAATAIEGPAVPSGFVAFRGIEWGTQFETVQNQFFGCGQTGYYKFCSRRGDMRDIGVATLIRIVYGFHKGRFYMVEANFDAKENFKPLKETLEQKHGSPSKLKSPFADSGLGSFLEDEAYGWGMTPGTFSSAHECTVTTIVCSSVRIKLQKYGTWGRLFYFYWPIAQQSSQTKSFVQILQAEPDPPGKVAAGDLVRRGAIANDKRVAEGAAVRNAWIVSGCLALVVLLAIAASMLALFQSRRASAGTIVKPDIATRFSSPNRDGGSLVEPSLTEGANSGERGLTNAPSSENIKSPYTYKVVVEGNPLPGFIPDEVRGRLAALVNRTEEVAAKLLSGRPSTVKTRVDQTTGTRYVSALTEIGVACHLAVC